MPTVALFDGIKISVNSREHNPPHIHAEYGENEVLIDIRRIEVVRGGLPNRQQRKVFEWVESRQDELLSLFKRLNPELR
jgi:hypothetical protein